MSKARIDLGDVAETLLLTLYFRAVESQRPDALVEDARAVALMDRIDYDFSRFRRQLFDLVPTILRVRQFDRYTRAFLAEHPDGRVVQIGCGLDTRFDRVDNGRVEWYDLDLPNVIALRRQLLPETSRCHFIGCSILDFAWMDTLANKDGRRVLLLADGTADLYCSLLCPDRGGWWRYGFCPTPSRGDILGLVEWVVAGDSGRSAARREVGLR